MLLLLSGTLPALAAKSADEADHEQLRALLRGVSEAINSKKYEDLAPHFHEDLRVTTINQEVLNTREQIAPYFAKWFGTGGFLKDLRFTLTPDALTEFHADKRFGVVQGSGLEEYTLADGRRFDMKTRWTATMLRGADGKWRILALHVGTDFLDNPVLGAAKGSLAKVGALAGLGALLAGLLLGWILKSRCGARPAP